MFACVQLLGSHSAGKPIFEKCNVGRCSRELFIFKIIDCVLLFSVSFSGVVLFLFKSYGSTGYGRVLVCLLFFRNIILKFNIYLLTYISKNCKKSVGTCHNWFRSVLANFYWFQRFMANFNKLFGTFRLILTNFYQFWHVFAKFNKCWQVLINFNWFWLRSWKKGIAKTISFRAPSYLEGCFL